MNTTPETGTTGYNAAGEGGPHAVVPPVSRLRRLFRWMRTHKIRTLLILTLLFILLEVLSLPLFTVARLRTQNPAETALMRQRVDEAKDQGRKLRIVHKYIPMARLPRHVIDAVVVAEDGTFFSHDGVDWFEVRESVAKNIKERRAARGGSTITQQLAKNLYLSTSKDPVRKLKELAITYLLEKELGKQRILELYLNNIEWGPGVFGIESAAQLYFGKSAAHLTLDEATRLAAVIPSPLRHRPNTDSRYVMRRKDMVLRRMQARNMAPGATEEIAEEELEEVEEEEDGPEALPPEGI